MRKQERPISITMGSSGYVTHWTYDQVLKMYCRNSKRFLNYPHDTQVQIHKMGGHLAYGEFDPSRMERVTNSITCIRSPEYSLLAIL